MYLRVNVMMKEVSCKQMQLGLLLATNLQYIQQSSMGNPGSVVSHLTPPTVPKYNSPLCHKNAHFPHYIPHNNDCTAIWKVLTL